MSDSDWGKRFATRVAIGSLVAVIAVSLASLAVLHGSSAVSEYEREASEKYREYIAHTYGPKRNACIKLPFLSQPDCIANAEREAREYERQEQDLVAQRVTAIWTMLMGGAAITGMLLSILGVYLVWTTFRATKEGNRIAKQIGETQVRAYVTMTVSQIFMHPRAIPEWSPTMNLEMANSGLSPAEELSVSVVWQLIKDGLVVFEERSFAPRYDGLISVRGNGGTNNAVSQCVENSIPLNFVEDIRYGRITWRIDCVLTYFAGGVRESFPYSFISLTLDQGDGTKVQKSPDGDGFSIRLQRVKTDKTQ